MKKMFTQKEIFDFLNGNPLNAKVHVGDLEDLNNQDYIFFDYLTDTPISADNQYAGEMNEVQFTVCVKNYQDRRTLVEYIKTMFQCSVSYENAEEHEYYLARMRTGILIASEIL